MSGACIEWRGEIGAYIVGALDRDAAAAVSSHLMRCVDCRGEYNELAPLRTLLDVLSDQVDWARDPPMHASAPNSATANVLPAVTRPRRRRRPVLRSHPPRRGPVSPR